MADDALSKLLSNAFQSGATHKNFAFDIAGDLGLQKNAPTLTNLQNTLLLSAHGGAYGTGFSPDKSATNELAKTIQSRIDAGKSLTLKDLASSLGSATNDVKRAVISACYAAGYSFNDVKRLFPNLEQLVAPSTMEPVSAVYDRNLVRPSPSSYITESLSPYYSITPTSTNVVRQASDWLNPQEAKRVVMPLSVQEAERDKALRNVKDIASPSNYSPQNRLFTPESKDEIQSILEWQKQQYKREDLTRDELNAIGDQTQKKLDDWIKYGIRTP